MLTAPQQNVAIIYGHRDVTDTHLAGTGLADVGILVPQHFGTAGLMEADGFHYISKICCGK